MQGARDLQIPLCPSTVRNTPVGVPASEVPAASDLGVELVARSPGAVEGATQGQLPVSPSAPAGPLKLIATFPGFTVLPDEALSWRIVLETQVQRPTPGVAPSPASTAAAAAAAASPFFSLHTVTPPEQDLPSPGTLAAALGAERVLRHLQSRSANAFQALGVTSDPARLPDEDVPAAAEAALRAIGVASPILRAASGERSVAAVVPVVVAGMLRECAEWLVGEGAAVGTAEARVVRRAAAAAEARSPATPGGWFGGIFRRGATAAASTPGGSSSSGGVAGSPGVPATPDPLAPVDTAASAAAASEHLLPPYLDPAGGGSDTERLVPDPTGAAPAPPSDAAAGGESPERGESSEDRLVRLRATADVLQVGLCLAAALVCSPLYACTRLQSCLLTLVEATDVLMGRSLAASLESHAAGEVTCASIPPPPPRRSCRRPAQSSWTTTLVPCIAAR